MWGRVRYARNAAQAVVRIRAGRFRVRAPVAGGVNGQGLVYRDAVDAAGRDRRRDGSIREPVGVAGWRTASGSVSARTQRLQSLARPRAMLESSLQQAQFARGQALRALELLVGRYPAAEISARAEAPCDAGPRTRRRAAADARAPPGRDRRRAARRRRLQPRRGSQGGAPAADHAQPQLRRVRERGPGA